MTIEDLALTLTPGVGLKYSHILLDVLGSAEAVFSASRSQLERDFRFPAIVVEAIVNKRGFSAAEREIRHCARHDIKIIASCDDCYPPLLREANDFPHVIFVQGSVDTFGADLLSIVGTRHPSQYGLIATSRMVDRLAEQVPNLGIVSGLAVGIDVEAHAQALHDKVRCIGVLPSALPTINPAQSERLAAKILENGGTLLSELPSLTKERGFSYIARNRIIAAMSMGTLVVESGAKGGSLHTANFADGYGRSVMALPGRVGDVQSVGTNRLIRSGLARMILSADDIIENMGWQNKNEEAAPTVEFDEQLTSRERELLELFPPTDTVAIGELSRQSSIDIGELTAMLSVLELGGHIKRRPGNCYILSR